MASDSFTDTNGTHLLDHTSEMRWTAVVSDSPDNFTIQGNALQAAAWAALNAFASTSTVDSSKITHLANVTTVGSVMVCVRMPVNNRGYAAYFDQASGGNWTRLSITKNGVYHSSFADLSYAQAENHTIRITAFGTDTVTLEVFVDDGSLGTKTDSSTPLGAGNSGFVGRNNTGSAVTIMDDWTDGVAAGPTIPGFMHHYDNQ